jgi:hypothetical protein
MINFAGFPFYNELKKTFWLQNNFQPVEGETTSIGMGLYNVQGQGYIFSSENDYGQIPTFKFQKLISGVTTTLFDYTSSNSRFDFKTNRVSGADPAINSDFVTKGYLNNGGVVTAINYSTTSDGLIVNNSTSGGTNSLTTDLNNNLKSLATLASTYSTNGTIAGVVLKNVNDGYSVATAGTSNQILTIDSATGNPKFKDPQTVTSVDLSTTTDGLSISGSPITQNGTISVNLSSFLQSLHVLASNGLIAKTTTGSATIPIGTEGQVLAIQGSSYSFIDRLSSVGISGSVGLAISGSPVTTTGTISIILSSLLQSLVLLGTNGLLVKTNSTISSVPISSTDGQVLTASGGNATWVTPAGGGNVTGASSTTVNALAIWGNSVGTSILNSTILVTGSTFNVGTRTITGLVAPTNNADAVDYLTFKNAIANIPRNGTIYVNDIGGSPTGSLTVTGAILSAVKTNPTGQDSNITFTYADLGYVPVITGLVWKDTRTGTGTINDIWVPIQSSEATNTTCTVRLEKYNTTYVTQGTLTVTFQKLSA